jgi:tetratricopeptide (TPR) repeat protein
VYSAKVPAYSQAIDLLDRALALQPDYGPALAFASWAHERRKTYGGTAPAGVDDVDISLALAQRALDADPDDALAMGLLGWERILFRVDYSGLDLCTRAAELNPNNRAVLDLAAVAHIYAGDLSRVLAYSTRALQLSPGATDAFACMTHLSSAHLWSGRYAEAAEWARRSMNLEKEFVFSHMHLAIAEAYLGNIVDARAAMKAALALRPDFNLANQNDDPMRFPDRKKLWVDGCRLAGMPEG